jgi:hypothetical protein
MLVKFYILVEDYKKFTQREAVEMMRSNPKNNNIIEITAEDTGEVDIRLAGDGKTPIVSLLHSRK